MEFSREELNTLYHALQVAILDLDEKIKGMTDDDALTVYMRNTFTSARNRMVPLHEKIENVL